MTEVNPKILGQARDRQILQAAMPMVQATIDQMIEESETFAVHEFHAKGTVSGERARDAILRRIILRDLKTRLDKLSGTVPLPTETTVPPDEDEAENEPDYDPSDGAGYHIG